MSSFACSNVTLPYPTCAYLLKYCSKYNTETEWCKCMVNVTSNIANTCEINIGAILGGVFGSIGAVVVLTFICICCSKLSDRDIQSQTGSSREINQSINIVVVSNLPAYNEIELELESGESDSLSLPPKYEDA
jgi:hypothetical protein